jgi:hypothetical protein
VLQFDSKKQAARHFLAQLDKHRRAQLQHPAAPAACLAQVQAEIAMLASSSAPPGAMQRILGHASFATTMKLYGGLTAAALESAAGTLGNAFESAPAKNRTNDSR